MHNFPANADKVRAVWRAPDPVKLGRLTASRYVAHNIPLTEQIATRPGEELISDSPRIAAIRESLHRFVGPDLQGRTAVDLGCLEGGITFELWRAGLTVLGVEGRDENYRKCLLLQDYYQAQGGMEFLLADVRSFRPARPFDVVVCSGLLYHLDDPAAYIGTLGQMTAPGGMLYLDTHVAPQDPAQCEFEQALSPIKTMEAGGITVRYCEFDEDTTKPESSIGNRSSIWMDTAAHLDLMYRAGFPRVFELNGYFGPDEQTLKRRYSRKYFVGLKRS